MKTDRHSGAIAAPVALTAWAVLLAHAGLVEAASAFNESANNDTPLQINVAEQIYHARLIIPLILLIVCATSVALAALQR